VTVIVCVCECCTPGRSIVTIMLIGRRYFNSVTNNNCVCINNYSCVRIYYYYDMMHTASDRSEQASSGIGSAAGGDGTEGEQKTSSNPRNKGTYGPMCMCV
jgi:hypothetical protein